MVGRHAMGWELKLRELEDGTPKGLSICGCCNHHCLHQNIFLDFYRRWSLVIVNGHLLHKRKCAAGNEVTGLN